VNVWYDTAKKLTYLIEYLRIYWTDFRNLFTNLFNQYFRFKCRWWICTVFFCQGTLPWQPNNIGRNKKVMKAGWYHVHSLHVRQVVERLCFTTTCKGATAAPSGICA